MEIGILGTGGVAQDPGATLVSCRSPGHARLEGSVVQGRSRLPVALLIDVVADHDVVVNATPPGPRRRSQACSQISGGRTDPSSTSGGIQSARGPEHYFLMFAALMQSLRTPRFNIHLVV